MSGNDELIIGLDFGTTYSGIAYAFSAQPEKVYTITEWDGMLGKNPLKVPTTIKYQTHSEYTWGYEVDPVDQHRIDGVKLLLDPDQLWPIYLPPSGNNEELERIDKTPVEVASDYVSAVYYHALAKIESKNPRGYIASLSKKLVLTVPAVWSDKAKYMTMKAAKLAGIEPVILIKEPEAAALFTLRSLKEKSLTVGDCFVLCDAGGGTVDLISYEITHIEPLELKELGPSTGGLAGSLGLNRGFERYVESLIGETKFASLQKSKGYRLAMKDFDENIKTAHNGCADEEYYIHFPLSKLDENPSKNIESNCLTLTGEKLNQIFQPLVRNIEDLVMKQINFVKRKKKNKHRYNHALKAVFLVGGFGSSVYLKNCIQRLEVCADIPVIQPEESWAAVVRGAVLSELPREVVVVSSVALKYYGVAISWECSIHEYPGQKKFMDPEEQVYRVDKMSWYIKKGEELRRGTKIEFRLYRTFEGVAPAGNKLIVTEILRECDRTPAPKYPQDELTKETCYLIADLREIPKSAFHVKSAPNGKPYSCLYYNLVLVVGSASMIFSIVVDGITYGEAVAEYH